MNTHEGGLCRAKSKYNYTNNYSNQDLLFNKVLIYYSSQTSHLGLFMIHSKTLLAKTNSYIIATVPHQCFFVGNSVISRKWEQKQSFSPSNTIQRYIGLHTCEDDDYMCYRWCGSTCDDL